MVCIEQQHIFNKVFNSHLINKSGLFTQNGCSIKIS